MEQEVQTIQDSLRATDSISTPFDSIWTGSDVPTVPPSGLEQIMLADDKIFVVMAIVLIIWIGLIFFIYRTDRRLRRVERSLEDRIYESDDEI
ncbi:MAG: CcmD family protein [Bacteroidetes bacterium]|nr:MAG: CcmD family protein [Bacteroidota bacterium]